MRVSIVPFGPRADYVKTSCTKTIYENYVQSAVPIASQIFQSYVEITTANVFYMHITVIA